jgi:hypothetical protein
VVPKNFVPLQKINIMTTVSSRVFSQNPIHYLNLAIRESVAVKRGNVLFRIIPNTSSENISPSGDPYWADPRNVAELNRILKLRDEGEMESFVLTPEKEKEWFGDLD